MQSTTIISRLSFDLVTPPDQANHCTAHQSLNRRSTLVVCGYCGPQQATCGSRAHGVLIQLMLTARLVLAGLQV